jgi:ribosomal protein S18 acetylase RimI-like enzyme
MISYTSNLSNLDDFEGFFVDWPNPPSIEVFKSILDGSYIYILATENRKIVGFITAISDGVLSAYIPFLEVLPNYQKRGIGRELVLRMKDELKHLYMIDLLCDSDLIGFYEKIGMDRAGGAMLRNYTNQNGSK